MNQEERRQKRQDEFKHAAVVVTVFVLVLAVMIIGAAAALHKFLPKGTKEVKTPDTQSTEISDDIQTSQNGSDVAEPVVDPLDEQAAQLVSGVSLEDKVAQMFVITPEAMTGSIWQTIFSVQNRRQKCLPICRTLQWSGRDCRHS